MTYPTPRTFGYRPPMVAPPPPTWDELLTAGCKAAGGNTPAFLRGVWAALEAMPVGGQLKLPLGETFDDLEERRQLVRSLITLSARESAG